MIETDTLDRAVLADRSRHSGTRCYLACIDGVIESRRGLVQIMDDDAPELERFTAGWHPGGFYDGDIYSMPDRCACRADVFDSAEAAEVRRQQLIADEIKRLQLMQVIK